MQKIQEVFEVQTMPTLDVLGECLQKEGSRNLS